MTYKSEVLADSPAFFLPLDETGAVDSAGGASWAYGPGVTFGQAPLLADGGKSVSGNGAAVIASTGPVPAALSGANVTAEAWVYLPGTNVQGTFVKIGNSTTGWGFGVGNTTLDTAGQKLVLIAENVAWVPTTYTFPGAGIYHVAVVRGSGTATAYVNGAQVWSGSFSPNIASGEMAVGGRSGGLVLSSSVRVDNVAIFPAALSASRLAAHYASGSGDNAAVSADAPSAWLKFDEANAGAGATDAAGGASWTYAGSVALAQPGLVADGGYSTSGGRIASLPSVPSGLSPVRGTSLEAWVNLPSASLRGIVVNIGGGASGWGFGIGASQLDQPGNNLVATLNNVSWNPSGVAIGTGTHHLVVTLDSAGMMRFYIDGTQVASQSTSPPAAASGSCSIGGRAAGDSTTAYDLSSSVRVDAVAAYPSVLSAARVAAHYAAGSTPPTPTTTGTAPVSVGSSVRTTLVATTTGSSPVGVGSSSNSLLTGVPLVTTGTAGVDVGSSGAAALVIPVTTTTGTAPVTAGSSSSSAVAMAATGTAPVGVGSSSRTVGDAGAAVLKAGVTVEVGAVSVVPIVLIPGIELEVGAVLSIGEATAVVPLPGISIGVGASVNSRAADVVALDPRSSRPQWRYVVTDLQNTPLGELVDIQHDPVADGVNTPTLMKLVMSADDPARRALIESAAPLTRKCQVWEGEQLLLWGPLLPDQQGSDGLAGYTVHDPSWWWRGGRRVIGRLPRKNLLQNGDFTRALAWWTPGFDRESIPAAAPKVRVVSEDFVNDSDGLDPIHALEITGVESVTEAALSSSAVFYPNRPFAWEPLAAGFRPGGEAAVDKVADAMPDTAGLQVTVIGHTANDGTGDGKELSLRRAQAAAARIKAKRPGAVITTRGVGYYKPDRRYPKDSQEQRRVVIQYDQTISGKSRQFVRQRVEVTQPKEARYPLVLTAAALLKVADDWSIEDANMMSVKILARRKFGPVPPKSVADALAKAKQDYDEALAHLAEVKANKDTTSEELESARESVTEAQKTLTEAQAAVNTAPWDEQLGVGSTSISDTDPVDRWLPQTAQATVPADGRPYLVDVFLYAPAALARYTAVGLWPEEELYFWGADQADIVKGLVEHIQDTALGHGNLGIEARTPATGIKRDRTYPFREHMPADTALEEFGGLNRGMDYDTLMYPDGRVVLATYFPHQGKRVDYVLAQGGNVADATPEQTRDVASSVIMQAQDLGSYRAEAYARDPRAFGGMLPERVVTAEQGTPLNELAEGAKQEIAWGATTTTGYWLDIPPHAIGDVLAHTSKGDIVRLILDDPQPVDRLVRILNRERHPESLRLLVALES